ncbi:hypothetical protein BIW11_09902 [Tropilaelaps mercedesae]|uniref:Fibronectin type-III domain-containing protein n=1 Tax=Tropilaelaps mercedesae TaxID=418985 RepID=A0A1V9XIC0_9ACAR|nr:hypothetical protein BIW11_09902 [Tropilaelaps mercedesae]
MLPRSLESALLAIVLAAVVTDCGDCMLLGIDTLAPPRHFEVERMTATNVTLQWDPPLLSQTDLPLRGYAFAFNRTKEIELAGYRHIVAWNYLECYRIRPSSLDGGFGSGDDRPTVPLCYRRRGTARRSGGTPKTPPLLSVRPPRGGRKQKGNARRCGRCRRTPTQDERGCSGRRDVAREYGTRALLQNVERQAGHDIEGQFDLRVERGKKDTEKYDNLTYCRAKTPTGSMTVAVSTSLKSADGNGSCQFEVCYVRRLPELELRLHS